MNLLESLVDKAKAILEANMPAKLDSLEETLSPAIPLSDIKAYYISEKADIPEYPAVLILGDSILFKCDPSLFCEGTAKIIIVVAVIDQDEETLRRKIYRYTRAIAEVIIADQTLGGTSYKVEPVQIQYTPMFSDSKRRLFVTDAWIELAIFTAE